MIPHEHLIEIAYLIATAKGADTEGGETVDAGLIGAELANRDIVFDRWPIKPGLDIRRPPAQILAEYADRVDALNGDGRYKYIDVAALQPDDHDPGWRDKASAARAKFLAEHRHAEDEVRFFVAGRGETPHVAEPSQCCSGGSTTIPASFPPLSRRASMSAVLSNA